MKKRFVVRPVNDQKFPWGIFDGSILNPADSFVGRFAVRATAEAVAASLNRGEGCAQ